MAAGAGGRAGDREGTLCQGREGTSGDREMMLHQGKGHIWRQGDDDVPVQRAQVGAGR